MPPEMEERVLRSLREENPERFEELQRVRGEKPMAYMEILRDILREREELERLKDKQPEEYARHMKLRELDRRTQALMKEYRSDSDQKKRTGLAEALKKILDEQFGLRQASREARAARLELELKSERDRLARRKEARAQIIDNRFKELVGENEDLKW
jgi:hypothetical protein